MIIGEDIKEIIKHMNKMDQKNPNVQEYLIKKSKEYFGLVKSLKKESDYKSDLEIGYLSFFGDEDESFNIYYEIEKYWSYLSSDIQIQLVEPFNKYISKISGCKARRIWEKSSSEFQKNDIDELIKELDNKKLIEIWGRIK